MLNTTHAGALADALDHARHLRRVGVNPARAIASIGLPPVPRAGWDDAVWLMARQLNELRQGAHTNET